MFGYDIGATSGVLQSLTSSEYSGTDWSVAVVELWNGVL